MDETRPLDRAAASFWSRVPWHEFKLFSHVENFSFSCVRRGTMSPERKPTGRCHGALLPKAAPPGGLLPERQHERELTGPCSTWSGMRSQDFCCNLLRHLWDKLSRLQTDSFKSASRMTWQILNRRFDPFRAFEHLTPLRPGYPASSNR